MKMLSIDQSAEILSVSRATVQRLVDSGRLPAVTIAAGKRKRLQRIDQGDLEDFVQNLKTDRNKNYDRLRLAQNS